jgi:phosphoribosylformylglycinamidine synthase
MKPKALLLHAWGTNRDTDLADAFELAGAEVEILVMQQLDELRAALRHCQIVALPGGFSYGDALGAGRLWALDLRLHLAEALHDFVASGRPLLGICNGFQTLVQSGILPGPAAPACTLTHNQGGSFQCRWVTLKPCGQSLWTAHLEEPIDCPVAHGEGNFQPGSGAFPEEAVALRYVESDASPALGFPANPNGSWNDVAGITNPAGNVLGLMPHPENHIHPFQHPLHQRGQQGRLGLPLLVQAVRHC